jgi:hypothetical protein
MKTYLIILALVLLPFMAQSNEAPETGLPDNFTHDIHFEDDKNVTFGNTKASPDAVLGYNTSQSNDSVVLGIGADAKSLLVTDKANADKNHGISTQPNPSVYVFSSTDPSLGNNEWSCLSHDKTDTVITSGKGYVRMNGATGVQFQHNGSAVMTATQDGTRAAWAPESGLYLKFGENAQPDTSHGFTSNLQVMFAGEVEFDATAYFDSEVEIEHTATQADDHTLKIMHDSAGFGDSKSIDIEYDTGATATGYNSAAILVDIDETDATGGSVYGLEVLATDGSADAIYAVKAGAVVAPIEQQSGSFANPTTGTNNTASTDVADMIDGSTGTNTTIFVADNDYIIIGAAAAFTEIEFAIETGVGNPGITPTFAYSTAGSGQFTTFSPTDGTDGFRDAGVHVVAWDAADLSGHTTNDDTGTFDIKITRTHNSKGSASLFYAKTAATTQYKWDANGDVDIRNLTTTSVTNTTGLQVGDTVNLELAVSSGTVTMSGVGGTALSTSNPGFVRTQSGLQTITANVSFIDDAGSSELIGNLFGATTGVAWANVVPFFIYFVEEDANASVVPMISRDPRARTSPAAANIGAPDDAVADAQGDFWAFDSLDETAFNGNPCVVVGSLLMSMTASDDWTVALGDSTGFGYFQEGQSFTMPLAQNGAETGTYFRDNGGTAPLFTTNQYTYSIDRTGLVHASFFLDLDPGTDGSGAVDAVVAMPYDYYASNAREFGIASVVSAGATNTTVQLRLDQNPGFRMIEPGLTVVANGDFSNGGRRVAGTYTFKAF